MKGFAGTEQGHDFSISFSILKHSCTSCSSRRAQWFMCLIWNTDHFSNSGYPWLDLQSFEFSFMPWYSSLKSRSSMKWKSLLLFFSVFIFGFILKCYQLQEILNSQSSDMVFHSWSDGFERRDENGTLHSWSVCIGVVVDACVVVACQGIFLKLVKMKNWGSLVCIMPCVQKWSQACVNKSGMVYWLYLEFAACNYTDFGFFHFIPGYFFFFS